MKKYFILTAIALVALASCAKETAEETVMAPQARYINVKVTAEREADDTKTLIDTDRRALLWGEDEYLAVMELRWTMWDNELGVYHYWGGEGVVSDKGVTNNGGYTMTFNSTFPENSNLGSSSELLSGKQLIYTAVYPPTALVNGVAGGQKHEMEVKTVQSYVAGSFDPQADILVADPQYFDDQQTDLHFNFQRITSICRARLYNMPMNAGSLKYVKFNMGSHQFTGVKQYDVVNSMFDTEYDVPQEVGNIVKIDARGMNLPEYGGGAVELWFNVWPDTIAAGESFSIVLVDESGANFTRTVYVSGEPLEFNPGKVTSFAVDMGSCSYSSVSSYYQKINFPGINPVNEPITLAYNEETYTSDLRVYSYGEWEARVTGGDWLKVNGNDHCYCSGSEYSTYGKTLSLTTTGKNLGDAPRTATVTITSDTDEVSFVVTQGFNTSLTGISIPATLTLECGETYQFTATPTPAACTNYTLSWSAMENGVVGIKDYDTGLIEAQIGGTSTVTVTARDNESWEEFTASCEVTVTVPAYTAPTNLYMTLTRHSYSYETYESTTIPTLVKNGVEIPLPYDGGDWNNKAVKGVVAGGKVVVVGTYEKNPDDYDNWASGACYWVDQVLHKLPEYDSFIDVVADGNDVYALATVCDPETYDNSYTVLKNWVPVAVSGKDEEWKMLAAESGDWYVAGSKEWTTFYCWKNGTNAIPLDGISPKCLTVKGGKVYVGGSPYSGYDASVWADGEIITLAAYTSSSYYGEINQIFFKGDDMLCLGHYIYRQSYSRSNYYPRFYKNGKEAFMPVFDGYNSKKITSACMFDGQLYILASASNAATTFKHDSQIMWETMYNPPHYVNEEQKTYEYSSGNNYTEYTSIFVD